MKYLIEAAEALQARLVNDSQANELAFATRCSLEYRAFHVAIARAKAEQAIDAARHDLPSQYIDRAHALVCKELIK
jgi:hypothetical protein